MNDLHCCIPQHVLLEPDYNAGENSFDREFFFCSQAFFAPTRFLVAMNLEWDCVKKILLSIRFLLDTHLAQIYTFVSCNKSSCSTDA